MIGKIRRLVALAVGVLCLVATLGRVRVDLSGSLASTDASRSGDGGAPTLLLGPSDRR